jgi:hypothetical protein
MLFSSGLTLNQRVSGSSPERPTKDTVETGMGITLTKVRVEAHRQYLARDGVHHQAETLEGERTEQRSDVGLLRIWCVRECLGIHLLNPQGVNSPDDG